MKKFLALLLGAAAVVGAVLLFNKKRKEKAMLFSQEFEEVPEDAADAESVEVEVQIGDDAEESAQ